jgi:diguanylate cyclase (GGDEF)-like protein/PAS domain S-box-containing protein
MQPAFDTPPPWRSSRPAGAAEHSAEVSESCREPLAAEDRERIQALFLSTSDLLATIAPDGRFTLVNPAWSQTLGWSDADLLGRPLRELVHPDDVEQTAAMLLAGKEHAAQIANFTNRYRHRDGSWRWLLWSARSDGVLWYAAAKDVSDRVWLERQALHDPLTKLPNRLLLMDRARQALTRLHRGRGLVAMLFIDLDRFKAVNDSLGHALGDHLLVSVSQRLAEMMRDSDTIARMGGDEFVILAEDLHDDGEALSVAERVLHALEAPFIVGSTEVSMLASVGVSVSHDPETDPETLLREADVAMYRAKRSGGYRLELFDERLRREAEAHLEIERRLRQALPRNELELAYQPIFALADGRAVACEALLRWEPGEGDPVKPVDFLERAQESGLIVPIGKWVVNAACRQVAAWRTDGKPVAVSINVSARGLTDVDLARRLRAALERHHLPPQALWIEVTESAVLGDPERVSATLAEVRACGVRVLLDKAGSHETRLSLIGALPLDALKLDRALIAAAPDSLQARALARALVALAREREIDTIAVGVQSETQLQLARELRCTYVQGFLLGEPKPVEQIALSHSGAVGSLTRWGPPARLHHRP